MKSGDGFVQGYNCQAAVDAEHQIIVAQAVTESVARNVEHLIPMVEKVVQNCRGDPPREVVRLSAGCFSGTGTWSRSCVGRSDRPHRDRTPKARRATTVGARQAISKPHDQAADGACKLATKRGAAVYARQKVIPEPVFTVRSRKARRLSRRFLLRGLVKVRGEWSLVALTLTFSSFTWPRAEHRGDRRQRQHARLTPFFALGLRQPPACAHASWNASGPLSRRGSLGAYVLRRREEGGNAVDLPDHFSDDGSELAVQTRAKGMTKPLVLDTGCGLLS